MGSCSSVHLPPELQGTWTLEQIRAHWAPHLHALPAAVMRPSRRDNHKIIGRVVELVGHNGLFSPLPLADPTWTAGRMDNIEYTCLIESINECTMQSYVGKPKALPRTNHSNGNSSNYSNNSTSGNHSSATQDQTESGYRAVRTFMMPITDWWLQHRGLQISFSSGVHYRERLGPDKVGFRAPCALTITILEEPPAMRLDSPPQHLRSHSPSGGMAGSACPFTTASTPLSLSNRLHGAGPLPHS